VYLFAAINLRFSNYVAKVLQIGFIISIHIHLLVFLRFLNIGLKLKKSLIHNFVMYMYKYLLLNILSSAIYAE